MRFSALKMALVIHFDEGPHWGLSTLFDFAFLCSLCVS